VLIPSAKGSYDTQSTQVTQMTSNVVLLDNLLAQYEPETNGVRNLLRRGIVVLADRLWREKSSEVEGEPPRGERRKRRILCEAPAAFAAERFPALAASQGHTDRHRYCANPPAAVRTDEQLNPCAVPVVLIFWLTIIFGSFGLFAKPSATVFGSLCVYSLSAAGAIYLVLELGQPFSGLMQISSAPVRNALMPLSP
jgi:hypothetical protein